MREREVVIIGAGPVGLFLACRLAQRGLAFDLVEARRERSGHSRAIGIHPPALERLAALGLAETFVARGVAIRRGLAFAGTRLLGALDFGSAPASYPFVLSLPQADTEALLEQRLAELAPGALERGLRLSGLEQDAEGVTLSLTNAAGARQLRRARFVVGCDGKESRVRHLAGFAFPGSSYPDTYLMGDFAEHSALGTDAAIYLCDEGLVEAFPLPQGRRRWVVRTERLYAEARAEQLTQLILARLGDAPDPATNSMLSPFGVQRHLARPVAQGRVLLAGDAAHVVSPIGGQGMNLGWLDAWEAAEVLEACLTRADDPPRLLATYDSRRRRAARRASRRAAFNMALGRPSRFAAARNRLVRFMLSGPPRRSFVRAVTMRDL